jgi:hypothetical protein
MERYKIHRSYDYMNLIVPLLKGVLGRTDNLFFDMTWTSQKMKHLKGTQREKLSHNPPNKIKGDTKTDRQQSALIRK